MSCATHGACASRSGPGTYCARGANGATACAACWECETFADAYDGACPATCDGVTSSAGTTFVDNYAYWNRVQSAPIEWSGVANATTRGCRACANARTSTHDGAKTWTSCGRAAGTMTRKNVDRWCDVANVTAALPYDGSCVASPENGLCGAPGPHICIATSFFDCCPTRPGVLAGVITAGAVFILGLLACIYRCTYRRRARSLTMRLRGEGATTHDESAAPSMSKDDASQTKRPHRAAKHTLVMAILSLCAVQTHAQQIELEFAQSHVIGSSGKSWSSQVDGAPIDLHLVGLKRTLAIVTLSGTTSAPSAGTYTTASGTFSLQPSSTFPDTYTGTAPATSKYSSVAMWADITPTDVVVGMYIRVDITSPVILTQTFTPVVGRPTDFEIISIPFYYFGADESMTYEGTTLTATVTGSMSSATVTMARDRLPVASFANVHHPGWKFEIPTLILGPTSSYNAFRATSKADVPDGGFSVIGKTHEILDILRKAEGNMYTTVQYYGSVIYSDANSAIFGAPIGSGLGGSSVGAGDFLFSAAFWHEQGHAFGLGHAGGEYDNGKFPYPSGSLQGSAWGFDYDMHKFVDVYAHERSAGNDCGTRRTASNGLCYKQDVMQSGNGDTSVNIPLGVFADVQAARQQRYFEGTNSYSGRVMKNATGHFSWDPTQLSYQSVADVTGDYWWGLTSKGKDGADGSFAQIRNTPLAVAIADLSCAELNCRASDGAPSRVLQVARMTKTIVYKPLEYTGDLLRPIQLDRYEEAQKIWPVAGAPEQYYCWSGCEYLLVFRFVDGSTQYTVGKTWLSLKPAFRKISRPSSTLNAKTSRSSEKYSQALIAAAAPSGGHAVDRVDVMYAPNSWRGIHNRVLQVVTSWSRTAGEVKPSPTEVLRDPPLNVEHAVDVTLPCSAATSCVMKIAYQFHVALEDAMFYAISSKVCLPEGSSVEIGKICSGGDCVTTTADDPKPYFGNTPDSSFDRAISTMEMTLHFQIKLTTSQAAGQVFKLLRDDAASHVNFVTRLLSSQNRYHTYFTEALPSGVTMQSTSFTRGSTTSNVLAASSVPNAGCGQYLSPSSPTSSPSPPPSPPPAPAGVATPSSSPPPAPPAPNTGYDPSDEPPAPPGVAPPPAPPPPREPPQPPEAGDDDFIQNDSVVNIITRVQISGMSAADFGFSSQQKLAAASSAYVNLTAGPKGVVLDSFTPASPPPSVIVDFKLLLSREDDTDRVIQALESDTGYLPILQQYLPATTAVTIENVRRVDVQITGDYDEDRDNVREYGAVVIAVLLAVFCVIPCGFVLLGVLIPNGKIGHSVQILLGPERYVRARKVFHLDPDVDVDWMKSLDAEPPRKRRFPFAFLRR